MQIDLWLLIPVVGLGNWAFRYLPLTRDLSGLPPDGWKSRFLAATGPAAIATLFAASILPELRVPLADTGPLTGGILAVVAVHGWRKSVVAATLAGSLVYGLMFAVLAG